MTAALRLEGVGKSFGGLQAVRNVSFELHEGEIVGLIGPNGAGKTTLINLIAGAYQPGTGRIWLRDRDVTGRPPHATARLGIARTFQIVRIFKDMTLRDNVTAGALFAGGHLGLRAAHRRADETLDFVGLGRLADRPAGEVGLADQKRAQLARALAMRPSVLLLDEAMAGLNIGEQTAALDLVRAIHRQGISLIIIEHLMKVIMGLSHRVIVMHHGQVIAQGTPSEIVNDQQVVAAYFGDRYSRRLGAARSGDADGRPGTTGAGDAGHAS